MATHYEVMYNTCYGGYGFSDDFCEELFRRYPPHTEIGAKLFRPSRDRFCFPGEEPNPEWSGTYVQIHPQRDPITGTDGYCYLYTSSHFRGKRSNEPRRSDYIARDNKHVYFLSIHETDWRDSPEVIALGKEWGLFGKRGAHGTNLALARIPVGYGFSIHEYDGMERVAVECDVVQIITELLSYIDTRSEDSLGPMSKRLVHKEVGVRECIYPRTTYDN